MRQLSEKLYERLYYLMRIIRIRKWWDKLLHVAGSAFLLWVYSGRSEVDSYGFVVYVVGVLCLLIGGYTINDVADFLQDRVSGRDGGGQTPRRKYSLIIAIAGLTTGMLLLFAVTNDKLPRLIAIGTLLIGVEYSLPPLRFKERGVWGVIVGAAMQRPALFLIFIAIMGVWNWLSLTLMVWLFCGGMTGMLGHQILDHPNDRAGGVRTFVTMHGRRPALRLCMFCAGIACVAVLSPLAFIPFTEALPGVGLLAVLTAVYLHKGLRMLRKIATELSLKFPPGSYEKT